MLLPISLGRKTPFGSAVEQTGIPGRWARTNGKGTAAPLLAYSGSSACRMIAGTTITSMALAIPAANAVHSSLSIALLGKPVVEGHAAFL